MQHNNQNNAATTTTKPRYRWNKQDKRNNIRSILRRSARQQEQNHQTIFHLASTATMTTMTKHMTINH